MTMTRRTTASRWRCSLIALRVVPRARRRSTSERLLNAAKEPQNWLTYSGGYFSQRYSPLTQITPANVEEPRAASGCYQAPVAGAWQSTPLVVDGIMYLTQRPNDVVALDAKTGRVFWIYRYTPVADADRLLRREQPRPRDSRRHALHGHARRAPGRDRREDRPRRCGTPRSPTASAATRSRIAPLVVKDKVIVGVGGGEYGIRGFIAAYDAQTGKEAWRFYTIPGAGRAGRRHVEAVSAEPTTFCDPEPGSTAAARSG